MTSKGKDCSSLFPAVVKNVISKNVELKKMVYMYLVHYAEAEPDNSLLAINSFQKDMAHSNQYIRGNIYIHIIYKYSISRSSFLSTF